MDDRKLAFRPSPRPLLQAPLTVRSVGRYTLAHTAENRRPSSFSQLFWVVSGHLRYHRQGSTFTAGPGTGFHYTAGEAHQIEAATSSVSYHWLTFDGPRAGLELDGLHNGPAARSLGRCPVELFEDLQAAIPEPDIATELRCAALGYRIFLHYTVPVISPPTGNENRSPVRAADPASRALLILQQRFADPDFSIEQIASALQCHRATLFRQFRTRHRMSPVAYLQRLRTREGLRLLRETAAPVAEVALQCGFRDPAYFARVIRRATGESPSRVRRR